MFCYKLGEMVWNFLSTDQCLGFIFEPTMFTIDDIKIN